jgi:integrase
MFLDKRDPLTEEEEKRMIDACRKPLEKLLVILPMDTGMRALELANLDKKDFIWQERKIWVQGEAEKDDRHLVQLTNRAYDLLWSWFTFKDNIGITKRIIQHHVAKVAKRAGLNDVNMHTLRRTFAVKKIKENTPTAELMSTLGFRSEEMFKAFLNIPINDIRQGIFVNSANNDKNQ